MRRILLLPVVAFLMFSIRGVTRADGSGGASGAPQIMPATCDPPQPCMYEDDAGCVNDCRDGLCAKPGGY